MAGTLERRRIVLGVTGSIAAYKAVELARLAISWGFEVRVVMTPSAQHFITPTTFQAITGNPVSTDFWENSEVETIGHVRLADWAEVVVIAPATADCIARLAQGLADSPLHAVCLATKAPLLIAPAMNVNMYDHPATQENITLLQKRGVQFVDPGEGALACGWNGTGRLADPSEIFYAVRRMLTPQDFGGKRVLITTGPTREPIDPVRFLSNRSSGKMGVSLAREAYRRGAEVTVVHGPISSRLPAAVHRIEVETAEQMHAAVMERAFPNEGPPPDMIIMAAAVADFRPQTIANAKLKKGKGLGKIELTPNPDILAELGSRRGENARPALIGFAVETGEVDDLLSEVRRKIATKNVDIVVGNFAHEAFDRDTNRVWIVERSGRQEEIATSYKSRIANRILDAALRI